ncbi:MAG TPA: SOS response-associated peptidase [Candidatus Poseidoniales archaeon]|nr:MAG TPA: SOS response-associated peptidase [Candidatus Poseidoniales archaeon]
MSSMCGRFAFGTRLEEALKDLDVLSLVDHEPRWNIAPTDEHPMLIQEEDALNVAIGRWGFTSSQDAIKAPINARLETASEKPMYKEAMRTARMAAPATGWYEWMASPVGRHPYHHALGSGEVMWLAGLLHPEGLQGFALLTQEAAPSVAHVHPRMPVVLTTGNVTAWLEQGALPSTLPPLTAWPVGMDVNRTGNEGAHLAGPIPTLF